ncbi:MAG TPA: SET domain-containing protein-lysine N-methyltransferase [Steroidobacteraceae bacterium]|nr:SET domain-containing protein-lysine N-methyltransferase [Steroidobacteraceae bacterium]
MATKKAKAGAASSARGSGNQWLIVRRSKVHGNGCFARKFIPKGTRIIEYLGERISHKEADARYEGDDVNNNHTFLFIADRRTVIDASNGGNEARWINHNCDGNCESEIEKSRVFVDARRDIQKGEELGYDYQIGRDKNDPPNVDEIYACRCGSPKCRGTMLWPAKRPKPRRKAKKKVAAKAGRTAAKRGKSKRSTARRKTKRGKSSRRT